MILCAEVDVNLYPSTGLETEEERDVFSILPPLGMNLGIGGSKKGSMIDLVKDDISSTPRQQRTAAPTKVLSVADALGLSETENRNSYHSSDTNTIPDIPDHHITPFAYPPSSASSSPSPSPPLQATSNDDLSDLNSSESSITPPPQDVFSSSSSRNKSNHTSNSNHTNSISSTSDILSPAPSSRHSHRRPLSRVVETEPPADPFQGDWDVRDYGKSLSPTHNGNGADSYYSSGEERG